MARIRQPMTYANTIGSQLLSAIINTFFFGIAFLMALQYFRRYARKDPIYVRLLVGSMIIIAFLQTIFVNHQSYRDTIIQSQEAKRSMTIEFTVPGKFMCIYLNTLFAHIFFASRIWILTKDVARKARYALIPIGALALLQFINGCIIVHLETISKTFADLGTHAFLNVRCTAMQGCATAAADILITVTLCYIYNAHRSTSSRVNSIVDTLIIYAIHRMVATSFCAMLNVFLYYFVSGTYYFAIPVLMTTQLYVISAISVLTSRESLREEVKFHGRDHSTTKINVDNHSTSEKSV